MLDKQCIVVLYLSKPITFAPSMVTGNGRHPRPSRARAVCLQVSSHSDSHSQSQSPPIFRLNRSTLTARRQFRSHPSSHRLIQEISFLSTQFFVLQTDKYLWGSHTGSCMIQCQFEEVCCKFVLLKKKRCGVHLSPSKIWLTGLTAFCLTYCFHY